MIVNLLKALVNQAGIIVLIAVFLSRWTIFRRLVTRASVSHSDKIILALLFGFFGIMGTYTGIPVRGALANARVVGVFVGGLIGGPAVGILAGVTAGIHRWAIDIGGFTAFACMVSTICEGLLAGYASNRLKNSDQKWLIAFFLGILAETMQMIIILILVRPYHEAWELVQIIGIPMITANAVGIAMFIAIIDGIFREQDKIAAIQSGTVLKIAGKTVHFFRNGMNEITTKKAALIILQMTDVAAVSFTDKSKILTHVGEGSDHHKAGGELQTQITRKVLKEGRTQVGGNNKEIGCDQENCVLESVVIAPLKENETIIGSLKLYRKTSRAITSMDIQLAKGLASLFSQQIELSRIDEQAKLLSQAELKALQSQINPHFLFNAINTIVAFIRTSPDEARSLLIHLGAYFRNNLYHKEIVTLEEELETVNHYLTIEKARFEDRLIVIMDIEDGLECRLPPLIIQPLVENALIHGLLNRIESGTLTIKAEKEKSSIKISISDNGTGMTRQQKTALYNFENQSSSIGFHNVNERLVSMFGESSGLKTVSAPGKGTTISFIIPEAEK